jgi:DNA-binding NarL/FixJ family response regulator
MTGLLGAAASSVPADELSLRELQVLRLIALGLSSKAIAEELHIATATVQNHTQHILKKLRCHSRVEAVVKAIRSGII